MLKPTQMTKITVIGTKAHLKSVIEELYELNVLHIEEHTKDELLDIGKPLFESEKLSEILLKLNALLRLFDMDGQSASLQKQFALDEVMQKVEDIIERANTLKHSIDVSEATIKKLQVVIEQLEILKRVGLSPVDLNNIRNVHVYIGITKDEAIRDELRTLKNIDYQFISFHKQTLVSVVCSNEESSEVLTLFSRFQVVLLSFDQLDPKKTTEQTLKEAKKEIKLNEIKITDLTKQLNDIKHNSGDYLLHARELFNVENEKAESPLKFGATDKSFLITGFIPSDNLLKVHRTLSKATDDTIILYLGKATKHESIPVKMDNPKIVKPFEFFMHLYTLPSYKEIDPTFFTFLTFPFFFGFMLGDMGYGLVNLILFSWLKKKIPAGKQLFTILIWSSLFTILMGAFFGEFFGFEELGHFHIPHMLSRNHQQMDLLMLSLALGTIHIVFSLLIGFVNEMRSHGFITAFFEKISWIMVIAGAGMFFLKLDLYGYILIGVAVLMLLKVEGPLALIELPSIFGNILSYARLMAIGLASVSLAIIVNEFAVDFAHSGGFMIIAAVLIMVVGHAINILLGLIGPFLHSLRLHYVEFFSKFYKGGGKLYRPFGYTKNEAED